MTEEDVKKELMRSRTPSRRDDGYNLKFEDMEFSMWPDYRNDCWVYSLPNGDISDTTFEDGCIESFFYYIKMNYPERFEAR